MATPQLSAQPTLDGSSLTGVANLANLFTGKNTTTSQNTSGSSSSQNTGGISTDGTVTTSENVTPEAVNALVKSILEGSQGLAAVSSGQARAGMYNSSTNQLLVNDLIARAAAEGAKLNKSSTVTTHNVQADTRATNATTNNTVNGTSVTAPPISGKTAASGAGILGMLSLVPSSVKSGIMDKLTRSGAASTAASVARTVVPQAQANITDGSTEPVSSTQVTNPLATPINGGGVGSVAGISVPGISTAAGGNVQTVSGINMPSIDNLQEPIAPDSSGNIDLNNIDLSSGTASVGSAVDTGAGNADSGSGANFDASAATDSGADFGRMGDFGDDVNGTTDDIDYGDYFAAEGGQVTSAGMQRSPQTIFDRRKAALDDAEEAAVNGTDTNAAYQKSLANGSDKNSDDSSSGGQKKSLLQRLIPSFAKGGMVRLNISNKAPGYADGGEVKREDGMYDESGRRRGQTDLRVSEAAKAEMPAYGFDNLTVGQISDLREERARIQSKYGNPPGYASGGMVDLTNTGLRNKGSSLFSSAASMDAGSSVQSVNNAAIKALQKTADQSPLDITPTSNSSTPAPASAGSVKQAGTSSTNSAGVNRVIGTIDYDPHSTKLDDGSDLATLYTQPDASSRPRTGNLGMTSGEAGIAGTLLGISAGVPSGLVTMANASNNTQATNAFLTAGASALGGPAAGLVTSLLLKKFNPDPDTQPQPAPDNGTATSPTDSAGDTSNSSSSSATPADNDPYLAFVEHNKELNKASGASDSAVESAAANQLFTLTGQRQQNYDQTIGARGDAGLGEFTFRANNAAGDWFLRQHGYTDQDAINSARNKYATDYFNTTAQQYYGGNQTSIDEAAKIAGFAKQSDGTYMSVNQINSLSGSTDAGGDPSTSANGSTGYVGGDNTENFGPESGATAFAADGGEISGPGTGTSDSIHAMLSDGEYVHTAKATSLFGTNFMDAVNDEDPVKAMSELISSGLVSKQQVQKVIGGKNGRS